MTLFSTFNVTSQVFCRSALSFGIVNLKPLIPGHVLICPNRVVPRLQDLRADEVTDLFLLVQRVGKGLERAYEAEGLTVSCQDGPVAGQSVPHIHIHLIPRKRTDFPPGKSDDIYPALESSERALGGDLEREGRGSRGGLLVVPRDEERVPRSEEEMAREAEREGRGSRGGLLVVPRDEERVPRSEEEMAREAAWLGAFFNSSES